MHFEPAGNAYVAQGAGYAMAIDSAGVRMLLSNPRRDRLRKTHTLSRRSGDPRESRADSQARQPIALRLEGSSTTSTAEGMEPLPGYSNYLIGADPARWSRRVPHFARLRYREVYAGIDVVYYGNQRRLEYDFVVKPNADPSAIRIAWDGVKSVRVAENGELVLGLEDGELRQLPPTVYQIVDGKRVLVQGGYRLLGTQTVSFALAHYDRRKPLIIDPVMEYASYLGGNLIDAGYAIAVDTAGNAYVAGRTESANFRRLVSTGAFQNSIRPPISTEYGDEQFDAFVVKVNATGTGILYSTYLGGTDYDSASGIAVDDVGNVYVGGTTFSGGSAFNAFPTAGQGAITSNAGQTDGFLTKLNSSGTALIYSTYFGTANVDHTYSVVLAPSGVFVTGWWDAARFPGQTIDVGDIFVARYGNGSSAAREAFRRLGNLTTNDIGFDVATDPLGNVFVTGRVGSAGLQTDFSSFRGGWDAFLARFNSALVLQSFTYLGGTGYDDGIAIAATASGEAFITGQTDSIGLGNNQYGRSGTEGDAFLARFSNAGSLTHFAYFGGMRNDFGDGIAVDASGTAYIAGFSESSDFPVSPFAAQRTNGGKHDLFVIRASPQSGLVPFNLLFSTYFGGSEDEGAADIAVSTAGEVYITGTATAGPNNSTVFPPAIRPPFLGPVYGGGFTDAIVGKLASASVAFTLQSTYGPPASGVASPSNFSVFRLMSATNQSGVSAESCGTNTRGGVDGVGSCPNCTGIGAGQTVTSSFRNEGPTGATCQPQPVRAGCETNNAGATNNEGVFACPDVSPTECDPLFGFTTLQVDRNGGERHLTLEVPTSCSWNAASDSSFVTIMSPAFAGVLPQGRGTIRLLIAPNNTGAPRTARLVASSVLTREVRIEQSAVVNGGSAAPLTASPSVVRFLRTTGGAAPPVVQVALTSSPNVSFQASSTAAWLNASPGSATTPATLQVSASTTGLATGTYSGNVNINAGGQTLTIPSTLVLFSPGTTSQIFSDVPPVHPWIDYIFLLNRFGVTIGCRESPLAYCPGDTVTQAQMAAFIIRALYGENFAYPATPYFTDVPASNSLFKYVQKMRDLNINPGCGGSFFCPNSTVSRGQMAIYIARALYGESYAFPALARFGDVPPSDLLFKYVQKIWEIGVTQGCTASNYCPGNPVTREQMAAFLSRSFFGYARLTP